MREEVLSFFIKDLVDSLKLKVHSTPLSTDFMEPSVIVCSGSSSIEKKGLLYKIKSDTDGQIYTPDINKLFNSFVEEIYSILILMLENDIDLNKVSIHGYDISSKAITKAKRGVYEEHSVHKLTQELRGKYFSKDTKSHYEIIPMIKNSVLFKQKNIFDLSDSQESYDVILSRNMFIYFNDTKREEALNIIANLLKHNGIYIKGHADHIKKYVNLETIAYGIYKKKLSLPLHLIDGLENGMR